MSKRYELCIFDLDGTILDTQEGIVSAVLYTIESYGLERVSPDELKKFIGPPVQESLMRAYGVGEEKAQEMADVFRQRYSGEDLMKATPYEGIYDVFGALKSAGVQSAVATYKREDYAIRLLRHFRFDEYTGLIHGGDNFNRLRKVDIIRKCMEESGVADPGKVVMVGDSSSDAKGAAELGVRFIAVTYGFGFRTREDCNAYPNDGIAENTEQLRELLL